MGGDNVGSVVYDARIDTARLRRDADTADSIVSSTARSGARSFENFSNNAANAFNGVASGIAKLAVVAGGLFIGGALGARTFIDSASELQSMRASFESMTGSAENASSVLAQLNKFSFETAFRTDQINKAAQLLLGAGLDVKKLGTYMKDIGDIAGATGADLGALTLPLSQALARGKLQTQDFYQILNSGAGKLGQVLQKELTKKGFGNLQDAMANGEVTAEMLFDVIHKSAQEGGFAFQGAIKQANTFNGRMSNLAESVNTVALKILGVNKATGEVDPNGVFAKMSNAVKDATDWLTKNKDSIAAVAKVIIDNAIPALSALAAAFAVAKTAAIAFSIAADANPFSLIALAIAAIVAGIVFLEVKFGVFSKAFENLKKALQPTIDWFQKNVWPVLVAIGEYVGGAFKEAWDAMKKAWDDVHDSLDKLGIKMDDIAKLLPLLLIPLAMLVAGVVAVIVVIATLVDWYVKAGKAVNEFIAKVVIGVLEIKKTISNVVGEMVGMGQNLMRGLLQGINNFVGPIISTVTGIADKIKNTIKSALGIHSPSRFMVWIGEMLMGGLGKGIDQTSGGAVGSARSASEAVLGAFGSSVLSPTVSADYTPVSGSTAATPMVQQINNINRDIDLDAASRQLAYQIGRGR